MGFKKFQDPFYQGIVAQVAFFFMLSIVPTLFLLTQILAKINISLEYLTTFLGIDPKAEYMRLIEYVLNSRPETMTSFFLLLMVVWAASRVNFCLSRVADYTYSSGRVIGNYFRDRLRAMFTIALTIVVMAAVIIFAVYGQVIIKLLAERLLISQWVDKIWGLLRWPVAAGLYLLVVSFNYYVLPSRKQRFRDTLPGGIFCSLGMLLVTMLYSIYSSVIVSQNLLYGSMATIVILMFWIYLIAWVLVLGILFNQVWSETRTKHRVPPVTRQR